MVVSSWSDFGGLPQFILVVSSRVWVGAGSVVEPDSLLSAAEIDESTLMFGSEGLELDVDSLGMVKAWGGVRAGSVSVVASSSGESLELAGSGS